MEFRILGPIGLYVAGQAVDIGAVKVRGMLGILLLKANKVVDADVIARGLWDEDHPPDPRKTLQVYVSRLRRALRGADDPARLHTEDSGYRLEVDPARIDYQRFLGLVRQGHAALGRSEHARAAECFTTAVDLWGRPLSDLRTSWAQHQRDTLTARELLTAYSALFEAKLELGDLDFVLNRLHPLLADHPHEELLARQWMRVLAAANRQTEIPMFFQDFTRRLAAELDARPSSELANLFQDLTARQERTNASMLAPAHRLVGVRSLPRDTPYFTGRHDLLARLDALAGLSVVTIDGPPGVGKTALVIHWARTRASRFSDGVLYADLHGYSVATPEEPAIIMNTFLNALGTAVEHVPDTVEDRAAVLRHLLTGRRLLIILDNVRDSAHVRPLLPALSPCPVLITSRQQLTGLAYRDGTQRITVGVLSDDDAKSLLRKRIGDQCSDAPVADLAALCARLPLALRIVGEHVAARQTAPIEELVADLRQTQRLLDAGGHGDDLTSNLRSAFSWSYNALSPNAARLFRLLGLHPTTRFSTQAATAIAGLSPEVTHQALDALIGAHLIQQERAERYYLHDVLHAYAADLSRADERTRTVRRMVDWYLRSLSNARELMTPDKHPVPALVSEENIKPLVFKTGQEAVQWCTTERHTLLSVTRLAWTLGLNGHVWRFAAGLGELLDRYGDLHEKVTVQSLGWEAAVQAGDRRAEAGCLNNLGRAFIRLHNYDRAEKCFEVALSLFHEAGDRYGAAVSLHNQATVRLERGDARQAINIFEQGLVYFAEAGPEWSEAHVHHRLGDCYRSLDDYDQADRCYQLALALRARIGDLRGQGTTLTSLGQLHLEQGKVEAAITYCEASIDIHRQTLDQGNMAGALCVLASAVMGRSAKQAIEYAQNATALYQALGAPQEQAHALTILATAFETAGELDSAHTTWTDVYRTFAILGDPRAAEAERRVHDLRGAVSKIPDPRLDQAENVSMKEKT